MLSQEDYDGIGAAVAKALRGEWTPVEFPPCKSCGKPQVLNTCAKVGESACACPVCDKAMLDAGREARFGEGK